MRRGAGVVIACVIAGCSSGGMEILVYGPADPGTPPPATVRLYIGTGDHAAAQLAPAPGDARFSAERWERDPANVEDVAPYDGDGPARFVFQPGGGVSGFGVVVAVGYDAHGVATSSAVLFDPQMGNAHVAVYRMGLNASTDPASKRAGYNSLALWGPSSAQQRDDSCVFVQNTYPDPAPASAFITSPGDRDCDGVPDMPNPPECDPNAWLATRAPSRGELSCLAQHQLTPTSTTQFCLPGGPACTDGVGLDTSCTPGRFCTHPDLCTLCGTGPTGFDCAKDLRTALPGITSFPAIVCDIALTSGGGSTISVCPDDNIFQLAALTLPSGVKCSRVQVRNRTQPFGDRLIDGSATFAIKVDDTCMMTVNGGGSYSSTQAIPEAVSGLLAVDFGSSQHGVLYPIVFNLTTGQCAPTQCHMTGPLTDQFLTCVGVPPPP